MKKRDSKKRRAYRHFTDFDQMPYTTYYMQSGSAKTKIATFLEKMIAFFFKIGVYRY